MSSSSKGEAVIYDVGVVGAGVMGSATAYFLAKNNPHLKIILLEQFDFLHRKGSSHGDSRIIRMTYPKEHYTMLMGSAYRLWAQIEEESGTKLLTKTGGLDIGREDNPELLALIRIAQEASVPFELLSAETLRARYPKITLPPGWIAVYSPSSGILNASKAVGALQSLARQRGCILRDNCPVSRIHTNENDNFHELYTGSGIVSARKVIFTCGPWTKKLLELELSLSLPLRVEQTTIAYWGTQDDDAFDSSRFPVFINYEEPLIYGTPAHEFPGLLKCSVHYGETLVDPDRRDFLPGVAGLERQVVPFLENIFNAKGPRLVRTESCLYTWTPDADFVLDEIPGIEGQLYIGCGFSGHGFKLAPVVGHFLSELVVLGKNKSPSYPAKVGDIFSIKRFRPTLGNDGKMSSCKL